MKQLLNLLRRKSSSINVFKFHILVESSNRVLVVFCCRHSWKWRMKMLPRRWWITMHRVWLSCVAGQFTFNSATIGNSKQIKRTPTTRWVIQHLSVKCSFASWATEADWNNQFNTRKFYFTLSYHLIYFEDRDISFDVIFHFIMYFSIYLEDTIWTKYKFVVVFFLFNFPLEIFWFKWILLILALTIAFTAVENPIIL